MASVSFTLGVDPSGVVVYICSSEPEDTKVRPELLEVVAPVDEDPEPDAEAEPSEGEEIPELKDSFTVGSGYNGLK